MNRIKVVNEVVRVLKLEFPGENINPEHELGKKVKPLLSVIGSDEEFHESITGASEMMIDLMHETNDEDGGGIDPEDLSDYVCSDDFKTDLNDGAVIVCHRVERATSELEREDNTSKPMLTFKIWIFS